MFLFFSDSAYDSVAYDPVKTMLLEKQIAEEPTNHNACSHALQLQFDTKIVLATLTILFSLDHKWQNFKWNQYFASNSVSPYASDCDSNPDSNSVTSETSLNGEGEIMK